MPRNVDFYIPFEFRISPDLDSLREQHSAWVRSIDLLPSLELYRIYDSWDFPKFVAYGFPDATGSRLDLAARFMGVGFLWDDQLEALSVHDPQQARKHAREMISFASGDRPQSADQPPLTRGAQILADVWVEMCGEMSPQWQIRAAYGWEWTVVSILHQGYDQARAAIPYPRHYDHVRRGVSGVDHTMDLIEVFAQCELPSLAAYSPQLRILRETIMLATMWCNDVYSLEKEEADGDVNNIVLVIEHAQGCSRKEAVDTVVSTVRDEMEQFERTSQEVPTMTAYLGLSPQETQAVNTYVRALGSWLRGYHEWEQTTPRYAGAHTPVGQRMPITNLVS